MPKSKARPWVYQLEGGVARCSCKPYPYPSVPEPTMPHAGIIRKCVLRAESKTVDCRTRDNLMAAWATVFVEWVETREDLIGNRPSKSRRDLDQIRVEREVACAAYWAHRVLHEC